ncbi:MAG: MlrC C-terminal domain-containing protein, partial [Casimicrobiaceae bacterium]
RAIVGSKCVIGVEHDPHCHMTLKRIRNCDIMVCYKEFPHTDVADRAEDLLTLVLRTLKGEIKPVMSLYDCRQIGSYPTTLPLMRGFVDRMMALEGKDGILSVSAVHCFPYADVEEMTSRILVVADGDKAKADILATRLGEEFVSMRGKTMPQFFSVVDGVQAAMDAHTDTTAGPVVIADPADNAGGGAPTDNTTILRHLIETNATGAAIGPIWDPIAVRLCFDAGVGARFPLRIGGKIGPASGQPLDALVEVSALARDCWQSFGPTKVPLGHCAAVRIGGIDGAGGVEVVLISNRTQALGLELFSNVGIDPLTRKILVVKSTNHFMAAFGPIAKRVIYIESDGPLARDYRKMVYTKVRRPIWPLDAETQPGLIF